MVGSQTVTTLSYSVTDGGVSDADGLANGVIVDPAGPAIPQTAAASVSAASAPNTGLPAQNSVLPLTTLAGAALLLTGRSLPVHKPLTSLLQWRNRR